MDPDKVFSQIIDLKYKIVSSKNEAEKSLKHNLTTSDQVIEQIKKTSERLQMYRKMKALQGEKKQKADSQKLTTLQHQYEITFKVRKNDKRQQKHTHFIERNLNELLLSIDWLNQLIDEN